MPQWIHDRAKHLRRKNPEMSESQSWAIATQQAHAAGKSPKSYGTAEGRSEANKKYDEPASSYEQTADPSSKSKKAEIDLAFLNGFSDELTKIAFTSPSDVMKPVARSGPKKVGSSTVIPVSTPTVSDVQTPETTSNLGQHKISPPPPVA